MKKNKNYLLLNLECQNKYTMACLVEQIHGINKNMHHWDRRISYIINQHILPNSIVVYAQMKDMLKLKHALYNRHRIIICDLRNKKSKIKEVLEATA